MCIVVVEVFVLMYVCVLACVLVVISHFLLKLLRRGGIQNGKSNLLEIVSQSELSI